jgi:hypothetical protein
MREIYKSAVTPQQKLVAINQKFGNTGIKDQQGTSRIIYDTLPYSGQTTFRFFEDSASRTFPFTNTGSEGNKLGVGDTMVIDRINFILTTVDPVTGAWAVPNTIYATTAANQLGYFNFEIANNQVIKKVTISESNSRFSKCDNTNENGLIDLETEIVIPPLLPYVLELRIPAPVTLANGVIICQIIGAGGIIAPRTTF